MKNASEFVIFQKGRLQGYKDALKVAQNEWCVHDEKFIEALKELIRLEEETIKNCGG